MPYFVSSRSTKSTIIIGQDFPKPITAQVMERSIFDSRGRRKFLVPSERVEFWQAAIRAGGEVATFCMVLTICGPRISEVLGLTNERIDDGAGTINFKTLKQRTCGVTRALPVPSFLLAFLNEVHGYRGAQSDPYRAEQRLWHWSRSTAWRRVKDVMKHTSTPAWLWTARALRHSFATNARTLDVELEAIRDLLGHKDIRTTLIYAKVMPEKQRLIVEKTYLDLPPPPQEPSVSAV